MEKKELKINAPEGYEIDKEKSTFENIVFKPVESVTYDTVCYSLFKEKKHTLFLRTVLFLSVSLTRYTTE